MKVVLRRCAGNVDDGRYGMLRQAAKPSGDKREMKRNGGPIAGARVIGFGGFKMMVL